MTEKQNDVKINNEKPAKQEQKPKMSEQQAKKAKAKLRFLKDRVKHMQALEADRAIKKGREPRPIYKYSKEIKELEEFLK